MPLIQTLISVRVNRIVPASGCLLLRRAMCPSDRAATSTHVPVFPLKLLTRQASVEVWDVHGNPRIHECDDWDQCHDVPNGPTHRTRRYRDRSKHSYILVRNAPMSSRFPVSNKRRAIPTYQLPSSACKRIRSSARQLHLTACSSKNPALSLIPCPTAPFVTAMPAPTRPEHR